MLTGYDSAPKSGGGVEQAERLAPVQGTRIIAEGCEETLTYYNFPSPHWGNLHTNNPLERLNREIRGRARVVGSFPDGHDALMLVSSWLRYMAGQKWGTQHYLNMRTEE